MATNSDQVGKLARGAWPALMSKVGVIEKIIDLTTVAHTNSIEVFKFTNPVLLLAVGAQITELGVSAGSPAIDLGDAENGTEYLDSEDPVQAAGTQLSRETAATNSSVIKAADSSIVLTIDTATLTAGKVRVWAVVSDVASLAG